MYNIISAKIDYVANELYSITVLVHISKGDVRAICATTQPKNGYMHIPKDAVLNNDLLQEVAGYGCEVHDEKKKFENWKSRL